MDRGQVQLRIGVGQERLHQPRRQQDNAQKDHSRHHGHSREPVPQQLPAAGGVLLAVVEADQGLTALGNPHHYVDDQSVGVGDDGVADQPLLADAPEDHVVEEQDHEPVAQLIDPIGDANGDETAVDAPIHPETDEVEGGLAPNKVAQIDHTGEQLGQASGHSSAPNTQIQVEDGHIVQDTVGQAAGDDGADGQLGIPIGLD